jgi:3,4-dihydroxy 2-butanone 4-phosphate synthase/GTP cyclohydrolase II
MNDSFYQNIQRAIDALKRGNIILLLDSADRENEGDFVFPAENITPEIVNFMIKQGTGIICVALLKERLEKLDLPLILPHDKNTSRNKTAFAMPVDAKNGNTGVSAADRAKTIQLLVHAETTPDDLLRPGHVYPLQADSGGVLARPGHTEGSIEIVRLAGFVPAAALCEAMDRDGNMIKGENLISFAKKSNIPYLFVNDLIQYHHQKKFLLD